MSTQQSPLPNSEQTAAPAPMDPNQKAMLLMAVAQLDAMVQALTSVPERVFKAAKEFKESLEEWANG